MTGKNILRGEFMKKIMCFLALCASVAFSAPGAYAGGVSDCMCKGQKLYGKVKVVRNFADFKVKRVSNFPDLKVKRVKIFPTGVVNGSSWITSRISPYSSWITFLTLPFST